MSDQPDARTARLDAINGMWRTEDEVFADDGETVVQKFSGTDTYEWIGPFFVLHRVDVLMGAQHVRTVEMIGPYDPERDLFHTAVYDGASGEVERSIATVDSTGVWSFRAGEGATRGQSTLRVDADGQHMDGVWSRTEDDGATWRPWMRLTLTRASPSA